MNNSRQLLKRLLKLYPIKSVKTYFQLEGNAEDVIENITGNLLEKQIYNFANSHKFLTKQHIFLLNLKKSFLINMMDNFPLVQTDYFFEGDYHNYFYLQKVTYKVTLTNPLEEKQLEFLQPITIRIKDKLLEIYFTKLEKTVLHLFPIDRYAIRRNQDNDEDQTLQIILHHFNSINTTSLIDINKGVKYLWGMDYIDAKKVQWKLPSSTNTVVMDEDNLFKNKYPVEYTALISQPLGRTLFRYLKADEEYCDTFDCDATNGQINIPKFSKQIIQVKNVISEILKFN